MSYYSAGGNTADASGTGIRIGPNVLFMHDAHGRFVAVDLPSYELNVSLGGPYLQLDIGGRMQWGLSKFYIGYFPIPLSSIGIRTYPFEKYLSLFANYGWGTFLFNERTSTVEAGFDIDIPVKHLARSKNDVCFTTFGLAAFNRFSTPSNHFIHGDQWSLTSTGVMFRTGVRFRYF